MEHFNLKFPARKITCEVIIGRGTLEKIPQILSRKKLAEDYLLLTDRKVGSLYGDTLHSLIQNQGLKCLYMKIPAGERSKDRSTKNRIEDFMLRKRCGRDAAILTLGGGVIGDIGGFTASTFMRGIPYVQIPTTLLSMVDSAIGGKTAINHQLGKNLIGSFHQPSAVIMDLDTLRTLPMNEYRCGIAEAIKYGAILDASLFSMIERDIDLIKKIDPDAILNIVKRCARLKGVVVQKDEREKGLRKALNFGHTIAHSIEALSSFAIRHGDAVAIGMIVESEISKRLGYLNQIDFTRLVDLLKRYGLPVQVPIGYSARHIMMTSQRDKKVRKRNVEYTLIGKLGSLADKKRIAIHVDGSVVFDAIRDCLAD